MNNPLAQGNKTLKIMLKNITNGGTLGTPNTAIITITDNQSSSDSSATSSTSSSASSTNPAGTLGFNAAGYTVNEAGNNFTVTVTRSQGTTGSVSVPYGTSNGTATSGTDYQSTSGTLTFAAGEISKTFQVSVIDNATISGNKTFSLILGVPTGGATITPGLGTITATIFDNDDSNVPYGSGALKFSKETYDTTKGAGTMTALVQRTGGASGTITVNYSTSNGSASSGTDYTSVSGTLTFLPGESSKLIVVPITKTASVVDNGKSFYINLSGQTSPATLISPYTTLVNIGN